MTSTNRIIPVQEPRVITNDMPYVMRDTGRRNAMNFADAAEAINFLDGGIEDKTIWDLLNAITTIVNQGPLLGSEVSALTYGRLRSMIGNPSGALYYPDGVDLTFEPNKATISMGGSLSAKIKGLDLALKKVIYNVSETVVGLGQVFDKATLDLKPIVWNSSDLSNLETSVDLSDPFLEPDERGTSLWGFAKGIKRKLDQINPTYDNLAKIIGPESYPLAATFSKGDYQRNVFGYLSYLNEETNPLSIRDVSYDLPTSDWTSGGSAPDLVLEIPTTIQDNYSENAGVALRIF